MHCSSRSASSFSFHSSLSAKSLKSGKRLRSNSLKHRFLELTSSVKGFFKREKEKNKDPNKTTPEVVISAQCQPLVLRGTKTSFIEIAVDPEIIKALHLVCEALHDPSILDARRHIRYGLAPSRRPAFPLNIITNTLPVGPRFDRSSSCYMVTRCITEFRVLPPPTPIIAVPFSSISELVPPVPPAVPDADAPRVMKTSDLKVLRFLGEGTNGKVYLVKDRVSKVKMALKVISKVDRNEYALNVILKERNIMAKLSHSPWFVKLHAAWHDNAFFYICMTMYPTDLDSEMIRCEIIEANRARFYMVEMIIGLTELHKLGIIHRDIKAPNILIDREGHIALADFGLSKDFHKIPSIAERVSQPYWPYLPNDNPTSTTPHRDPSELHFVAWNYRGSEMEMAPEIHMRMPYAFGVDFWSASVILFWMLTGRPPFYEDDEEYQDEGPEDCKPLMYKIAEDELYWLPTDDVDDITMDFLERMMEKDPRKRLMIEYAMPHHPYFAGVNWTLMEERRVPPPWVPGDKIGHVYEPTSPVFTPGETYKPEDDPLPEFAFNSHEIQNRQILTTSDSEHSDFDSDDDNDDNDSLDGYSEVALHDTEDEKLCHLATQPLQNDSDVTLKPFLWGDEPETQEKWSVTLINPPATQPYSPGPKCWIQCQDLMKLQSRYPSDDSRRDSIPSPADNSSLADPLALLPSSPPGVHSTQPVPDNQIMPPSTLPHTTSQIINGTGIVFKIKVWLWQLWSPKPKRNRQLKRLSLLA